MQAKVKKWLKDKRFGFLDNGGGPDVFVSQGELQNCQFLKPGVRVEFDCHISDKGLVARNVRLLREGGTDRAAPGQRQTKPFIGVMT